MHIDVGGMFYISYIAGIHYMGYWKYSRICDSGRWLTVEHTSFDSRGYAACGRHAGSSPTCLPPFEKMQHILSKLQY